MILEESLHKWESGANKGSKSRGEKGLPVWREGWWLFTERDGGRQGEEEREASRAEWC